MKIGLERAPFDVFVYFFSSFEHAKNLPIMGPNNANNSSKKCDFLIVNYEYYCQNLAFIVKKTSNLIKKLFLCFVSKPRVGPINRWHNTFKWGNIFATICTLVLSLWVEHSKVIHMSQLWVYKVKKNAVDKHSSVFVLSVSDEEVKVCHIDTSWVFWLWPLRCFTKALRSWLQPGTNVIKRFQF